MAQKSVAQTGAVAGPGNQAWNIGHDKFVPARADNAQIRVQGGERIISNFRASAADTGKQC